MRDHFSGYGRKRMLGVLLRNSGGALRALLEHQPARLAIAFHTAPFAFPRHRSLHAIVGSVKSGAFSCSPPPTTFPIRCLLVGTIGLLCSGGESSLKWLGREHAQLQEFSAAIANPAVASNTNGHVQLQGAHTRRIEPRSSAHFP